jgi:hypothetical protein
MKLLTSTWMIRSSSHQSEECSGIGQVVFSIIVPRELGTILIQNLQPKSFSIHPCRFCWFQYIMVGLSNGAVTKVCLLCRVAEIDLSEYIRETILLKIPIKVRRLLSQHFPCAQMATCLKEPACVRVEHLHKTEIAVFA